MLETGNKKKYTHRLSIRQNAGGFSLYIYNVLSGQLLRHDDVPLDGMQPEEALSRHLSRPRAQDTDIGEVELVSELPSTLIPLDEFRKNEVVPLYRLNYPSAAYTASEIRCEVLSALEVVVAYPVPSAVEQHLQGLYPMLQVRSFMGEALERFVSTKHKKKEGDSHFYVMFAPSSMVVCCIKEHKLHFACTYPANNNADRIYYLLSVWKNLHIESHMPCILCGAEEGLADEIRKFIAIVREE